MRYVSWQPAPELTQWVQRIKTSSCKHSERSSIFLMSCLHEKRKQKNGKQITFSMVSSNVFHFHNWKAQLKAVVLSSSLLLRSSRTSSVSLICQICCRKEIGYLLYWQPTSDSLHNCFSFLEKLFELWGNRWALEGRWCSARQPGQQDVSLLPHLVSRACCWFPGS